MIRREFITLLGGAAVAWPIGVRAQQAERVRRIGVLMPFAPDDVEGQARITAFTQGLQELGWVVGRNLRIDYRWAADDAELFRRHAAELASLAPEVILANSSQAMATLLQAKSSTPTVFVNVTDPVGAGFVDSLARPGGNATGFTVFEFGISGKWLEFLKEMAPLMKRVAVMRDLATAAGSGQLGAIQGAAATLGIELRPIGVTGALDIERALAAFARGSNDGLIVTATPLARVHRELIIALAKQHRLPAIYSDRVFVVGGGLISYGPNRIDPFRRAAGYIDRILKGEKPADLPVQAPTKYELAINLKTAKALGLTVPDTLLARADEVIE
jgi:putative ABC transport system substrate-binding protein